MNLHASGKIWPKPENQLKEKLLPKKPNRKNEKNNQSGFTLIELLVVIAIIGIISTLVIFNLSHAKLEAKYGVAVAQMREIRKAMYQLEEDTGKWPFGCESKEDHDDELDLVNSRSGLISQPVANDTNPTITETYPDGSVGTRQIWKSGENPCIWTPAEVAAWNGPYISANKLADPFGNLYKIDRDGNASRKDSSGNSIPIGTENNPTFTIFTWGAQRPPQNWGYNSIGIIYYDLVNDRFLPYVVP